MVWNGCAAEVVRRMGARICVFFVVVCLFVFFLYLSVCVFVCLHTSLLCRCADEEEEEGGEKNLCILFDCLFFASFLFVSLIGQFAFLLLSL